MAKVKKIIALIQARMSSSRLPGKVLMDISGKPMLLRVIERTIRAKTINDVAVITSLNQDDNAIEIICLNNKIKCFRGSLNDVLDRYYRAAVHFSAEAVVRITADCPLLDSGIVDLIVSTFEKGDYDYVSNTLECTYPDGLDTEIFTMAALEKAWFMARLKSEREHVTVFIYKHPELFRVNNVKHQKDFSSLRWTVDTPSDLEFVRTVYANFVDDYFGMEEVLRYLSIHPELNELNAGHQRNEGYRKSLQDDISLRIKRIG